MKLKTPNKKVRYFLNLGNGYIVTISGRNKGGTATGPTGRPGLCWSLDEVTEGRFREISQAEAFKHCPALRTQKV